MRTHLRGAPRAQPNRLGALIFLHAISLYCLARKMLTNPPRSFRRKRPRIDRVEVSSSGKYMRHSACRCTRWTGWNVAAFKSVENVLNLFVRPFQVRNKLLTGERKSRCNLFRSSAPYRTFQLLGHIDAKASFFESCIKIQRHSIQHFEYIGMRVTNTLRESDRNIKLFPGRVEKFLIVKLETASERIQK